jgi:hypothetical protein
MSNASVGVADVIEFDIGGGGPETITLASALPTITDAVTIDGTSQDGFAGVPLIDIDGTGAGGGAHGLNVTAGGRDDDPLARDPQFLGRRHSPRR